MSKENTLIYFKKTSCSNCLRFDNKGIFPQLETWLAKYPIDTAIIDFDAVPENIDFTAIPENKPLIEKNMQNISKYREELNKFQKNFKGVPTLVLFYKSVGIASGSDLLPGGGSASGSFLKPSSPVSVLKYFSISYFEGNDYLTPEVILADIIKKIAIIKDKGLQKKYSDA